MRIFFNSVLASFIYLRSICIWLCLNEVKKWYTDKSKLQTTSRCFYVTIPGASSGIPQVIQLGFPEFLLIFF